MSRRFLLNVIAMAMVCTYAATATSKTPSDCLQQGDSIGVFYVTKVAGVEDDGVEPGEDLCYRCRYGSSPMVMVFTRDTGGKVSDLVKRIDAAVRDDESSSLRGLITFMGEDAAKLKEQAGKIAIEASVKAIPVVIAKEIKTGPLNYRLPIDVDVTIVVARDSQVFNTHTFAADKIDIAAVMQDVQQMLDE